jgi:hypothetical protein
MEEMFCERVEQAAAANRQGLVFERGGKLDEGM